MSKLDSKRLSVTILPEWKDQLDQLKREKFYDKPMAELIRYLIELGLKSVKNKSA